MRRWRAIGAIALVVASMQIPVMSAEPTPAGAASDAVTWSVDHVKRVITVHARLTFLLVAYPGTSLTLADEIKEADRAVQAIVAAIKSVWEGQLYKCYSLHLDITTAIANNPGGFSDDSVSIVLLHTRTPMVNDQSLVPTAIKPVKPLSDDPADARPPVTGSSPFFRSSVWAYADSPAHYGALFGQVTGLDPTYTRRGGAVSGAPGDVMNGSGAGVSPATMTRLIRRSGLDTSQLKCPLTADLAPGTAILTFFAKIDLGVHLYTCDFDPPSSDPTKPATVEFKGTIAIHGDISVLLEGTTSAGGFVPTTGTWTYGGDLHVVLGKFEIRQPVISFSSGPESVARPYIVVAPTNLPLDGRFEFTDGAKECPP